MLKGLFAPKKLVSSGVYAATGSPLPAMAEDCLVWHALDANQSIQVTPQGLRFPRIESLENLTAIGRQWVQCRPALASLEPSPLGRGQGEGTDLVSFETFYRLLLPLKNGEQDTEVLDLSFLAPTIAQLTPELSGKGSLGSPDFRFLLRLLNVQGQPVYPQRMGAFVLPAGGTEPQLLPQSLYTLLEWVQDWNNRSPEQKSLAEALLTLAEMKVLPLTVLWDAYLKAENPIKLVQVGIGLQTTEGGRTSVYPTLPPELAHLGQEGFRQEFFRYGQVQPIYTFNKTPSPTSPPAPLLKRRGEPEEEFPSPLEERVAEGRVRSATVERVRLVCTPEVQAALARMRPLSHVDDVARDRVVIAPEQVFEGMVTTTAPSENPESEAEPITLEGFSSRVSGVGPYVYSPRPFLRYFQVGEVGLLGAKPETDPNAATGDEGGNSGDNGADPIAAPASNIIQLETGALEIGLEVRDADGNPITLPLANARAIERARDKVLSAIAQGQLTAKFADETDAERWIPVSPELLNGLDELRKAHTQAQKGELPEASGQHLLVFKNDDLLAYAEPDDPNLQARPFERPASLKPEIVLKPYQLTGIAWLQSCFLSHRKGVLLADDMGLGKTLQVMAFLAWVLEQGNPSPALTRIAMAPASPSILSRPSERVKGEGSGFIPSKHSPHPLVGEVAHPSAADERVRGNKPILIVAPVSLLDNWEAEMRKFFADDGAIFSSMVKLYGDNLKAYKNPEVSRKDEGLNQPALDVERLRHATVVLTNYETIAHYEYSFTRIPWRVVAADEAQKIKNDNTDASHVLRALEVEFRIAMTGTPVENRLLDLWAIMDFAQPGVLGFKREFSECYELNDLSAFSDDIPLAMLTDEQRLQAEQAMQAEIERRADQLQRTLRHGEFPQTFLLNRDKKDHLDDLPTKTEHIVPYTLSPQQEIRYQEILDLARGVNQEEKKQGQHLLAIHQLKRLHEHPFLLEAGLAGESQRSVLDKSTTELLVGSQKLQAVMTTLTRLASDDAAPPSPIKGEGNSGEDKVLIFTPSVMMQLILKRVIDEQFGLNVDIINGSPERDGKAKTLEGNPDDSLRTRILKRFAASEGFNVLILSPLAAGAGLNITCANHVIHYGRWWNPAVEAQATCRVYRIGQTKPVHVYYPIAESATFNPTFEQTLHRLLEKKEAIRRNFLRPMPPFSLEIRPEEVLGE